MAIYPQKGVRKGKFGFNLGKLDQAGKAQGTFDGLSGGVGGGIASTAGNLVSNIGKKKLGYGIEHQGVGASAAGVGLKGAGAGYEIGKNFGPMGAAIGAGAGLIGGATVGLIKGNKLKEEAEDKFTQLQGNAITDVSRQSRKKYGTLQRYKGRVYEEGGRIPSMSVILGGKLHKDGGNAIVFKKDNKKVAETEMEELLLSHAHTKEIDGLIGKYDKTNLNISLEKLGKSIQRILLNETKDNSGRYTD